VLGSALEQEAAAGLGVCEATKNAPKRGVFGAARSLAAATNYLIFASLNSTCLRATGSYFRVDILSVIVREFFLVT
jgi:hypothetical protein